MVIKKQKHRTAHPNPQQTQVTQDRKIPRYL